MELKIKDAVKYYIVKTSKTALLVSDAKINRFVEELSEKEENLKVLEYPNKYKAMNALKELNLISKVEGNYGLLKKKKLGLEEVFGKKENQIFTSVLNGNFVGVVRGFHSDKRLTQGRSNARVRYFDNFNEAFEWFKINWNNKRTKYDANIEVISFYNKVAIGFVEKEKYLEELFGNFTTYKCKNVALEEAMNFVLRSKRYFETPLKEKVQLNSPKKEIEAEVTLFDEEKTKTNNIFTDGSFVNENKVTSYGITVFDEKMSTEKIRVGGVINNRLYQSSTGSELWSVLKALELAIVNEWRNIIIHYDCEAVKKYSEVNLNPSNTPTELQCNYYYHFNRLIVVGNLQCEFVKVKGHSDNKGNNIADKIAVEARKNFIAM